jgi:hypothetical protein
LKVLKCGALRRMDISWTDRERNEVLQRVKEARSTVQTVKNKKKRKAYWIGHILRRNCLTKHVIEGMTG